MPSDFDPNYDARAERNKVMLDIANQHKAFCFYAARKARVYGGIMAVCLGMMLPDVVFVFCNRWLHVHLTWINYWELYILPGVCSYSFLVWRKARRKVMFHRAAYGGINAMVKEPEHSSAWQMHLDQVLAAQKSLGLVKPEQTKPVND